MAASVAAKLDSIKGKSVAVDAEDYRKKLAIARSVLRALQIAGIPLTVAAADMGYPDATEVSRWVNGAARPHFDKLFALDGFEEAWFKARAEVNPRFHVRTVIELKSA